MRRSRERLAGATAVVICGALVCVASDYGFGRSEPYGSTIGVGWDLLLALPFVLVAALMLFSGMSRVGAAVAAIGVAVVVVFAFHSANTSSSSTAPVVLLAPWTTGIPIVLLVWIADAAGRGAIAWRRWRRDERRF